MPTGEYTADDALTLSISAIVVDLTYDCPTTGSSTWTSSPSWCCAKSVMPTLAVLVAYW